MTEQRPWSFVAMQYYAGILNRTYLVTVDGDTLTGIVCRGITATEPRPNARSASILGPLAVRGDLDDPNSYVDESRLNRADRANFSIKLSDIRSVDFNPRKKWGMGYYPHDGRILVRDAERRREFIVLGNQSGRDLTARLTGAVSLASRSSRTEEH